MTVTSQRRSSSRLARRTNEPNCSAAKASRLGIDALEARSSTTSVLVSSVATSWSSLPSTCSGTSTTCTRLAATLQTSSSWRSAKAWYGAGRESASASGASTPSGTSSSTIRLPSASATNSASSPGSRGASVLATASHSRSRGIPWMPTTCQNGCRESIGSRGESSVTSRAKSSPPSLASCWWIGRSRLKKPNSRLAGLDQPVIAVAPAVDDVDHLRPDISEDEEVVPDELELEHGFLGRHRRHGELLRLDDRRLVLLDLDRR